MFDERIKELRTSLGLNQIQFGRKLFITKQCVCNWENGNIMPSVDMLIKICTTFSVSADYLLGIGNKMTLDVTGLNTEQVFHIQNIVNDLKVLLVQKNEDQI
ncbi:MAG: helix-turn-helix domain-containing protein [Clostridium sp.]|nr:helix-turn-helix domain-containing protein [Clostridium sp.]